MSGDPESFPADDIDLSPRLEEPSVFDPLTQHSEEPVPPAYARYIPNLAHTLIFFALAFLVLLLGGWATVAIGQSLPFFHHRDLVTLAGDARLTIPSQAVQYVLLLVLTALLFSALWQQPFWTGIRWNVSAVARRWYWLAALGFTLGLVTSLAGNYLPMPKEAPILNDMMQTTTGAWLMFLFGTTGAPLIEELAFRGFLLPSLVNLFHALEDRKTLSRKTAILLGLPVSVLLTSLPFALLHSPQVSHAWAPLLLIGIVSVALCAVRLEMKSLAASTLVHAAYNFTLFAGLLIASGGFRHLDKLNV